MDSTPWEKYYTRRRGVTPPPTPPVTLKSAYALIPRLLPYEHEKCCHHSPLKDH